MLAESVNVCKYSNTDKFDFFCLLGSSESSEASEKYVKGFNIFFSLFFFSYLELQWAFEHCKQDLSSNTQKCWKNCPMLHKINCMGQYYRFI